MASQEGVLFPYTMSQISRAVACLDKADTDDMLSIWSAVWAGSTTVEVMACGSVVVVQG